MEKFNKPEIEIIYIEDGDVIATSTEGLIRNPTETEEDVF